MAKRNQTKPKKAQRKIIQNNENNSFGDSVFQHFTEIKLLHLT